MVFDAEIKMSIVGRNTFPGFLKNIFKQKKSDREEIK